MTALAGTGISPGGLVQDRYEVLEVVGRGGQGEVLRALDRRHRRLVALKVRWTGGVRGREATLSEAGVLLGARPHPGLPLVRDDFFSGDGQYVVVMDWVNGTDLARQLVTHGDPGLPVEDVLHYLRQVADAVDHLHSHDPPIVHGDIKPANIVVDEEGRATLVDFGIAARGGRGVSGVTPGFTAPECAGGRISPASDIFSLAATAFALLGGTPPLPGAPLPRAEVGGDQGRALAAGLRRGLATDPSRRPRTAGELLAILGGERRPPTNLPTELTSFVGRSRETSETCALLRSARLVTLTGAGGVGKSRLALRVATAVASEFLDGTFIVSLAPLNNPELVASQVLAALGVTEEPGRRSVEALVDHLRGRRLLLVLDNCEHLVGACAELAETVLARCDHVRILATSRQPLGIFGEACVRVPPLAAPRPDDPSSLEVLAAYDAVALFLDRAHAEGATWAHAHLHPDAVAEICARLDGIPLAIELAAARARALSLPELAARLDDRFRLLGGAVHTPLPRHRTLRAAVEWSWDLLEAPERMLLRRLAIFAGGWTLHAAERVCSGDDLDIAQVAHWHCQLVDKSLLSLDQSDEPTRYRMLEDVRQYAAERLGEFGERDRLADRHLAHFAASAEADEAERLRTGNRLQFWRRQFPERLNIRAALGWAQEQGWPDAGLGLLASPLLLWRSFNADARQLTVSALARRGETPPSLQGKLLISLAVHEFELGNLTAACELSERSREAAGRAGDAGAVAYVLDLLGNIALEKGDGERALAYLDEALPLARDVGDISLVANVLHDTGEVWMRLFGNPERAMTCYEAALAATKDGAGPLVGLALVTAALGDEARGVSIAEEALRLARENWLGAHDYQCDALAHLLTRHGDYERAEELRLEALELYRRSGRRLRVPGEFEGLAEIHTARGDAQKAAALLGAADGLREEMETPVQPFDLLVYQGVMTRTKEALGGGAFEQAWANGRRMSFEEAIDYALQPVLRRRARSC